MQKREQSLGRIRPRILTGVKVSQPKDRNLAITREDAVGGKKKKISEE
jgi:hypothetical protein